MPLQTALRGRQRGPGNAAGGGAVDGLSGGPSMRQGVHTIAQKAVSVFEHGEDPSCLIARLKQRSEVPERSRMLDEIKQTSRRRGAPPAEQRTARAAPLVQSVHDMVRG